MQINRLFEMIYLLLNKKSITAGEFATHFEVSTRTIYRDVEHLSSAGIPIYMTKGKGGGISLISDFVLNKTLLTDGEKSDMLSAMQAMHAVNFDQSNTALQKLSALFGGMNTDWVEIEFSGWGNCGEEATLFASLKAAILSRQQVSFLYHGTERCIMRTVEPLKLCFKRQSWYLYAHCTMRNDVRFFKLRRMKGVSVLEERFNRVAPQRVFDKEAEFGDEFVLLILNISKEMAYRVYDEFSQYERLPNGDFRVQMSMPRGEWLYHYVATFGECCEIVAPEDIRRQVRDKLRKTLQHYTEITD